MSTLASGQIVANKYRLLGYVGSGGIGDVWAAQHLHLPQQFALKFIHGTGSPAKNPQVWERFEREGKALSSCESRHVARIYDWEPGKHGEHEPFIVMDLLRGRSLRQRLFETAPMSAAELQWIMDDVGSGIRLMHDRGVVHRDLKPENIFLVPGPGGQYATVLDSGVGMVDDHRTLRAIRGSSAWYASPEFLRNPRSVDARSDIWSLGMIAFECLLRTLPFVGLSRDETIALILSGESLPEPSSVAPVPPGFDAWFERACCHDRDKRFQSISLAIEALNHVCKARSDVTNLLDLQRDDVGRQVDTFRREIEHLNGLLRDLEAKHAALQTLCTRTCDELKVALRLVDDARDPIEFPVNDNLSS